MNKRLWDSIHCPNAIYTVVYNPYPASATNVCIKAPIWITEGFFYNLQMDVVDELNKQKDTMDVFIFNMLNANSDIWYVNQAVLGLNIILLLL